MATTVLGLKTFVASDPVDYNEINSNYNLIDNGVKTALQGRAAYNLLDNSWFANFVNQRGGTSTAGTWDYCIDRWRAIGTAGQLVWHNSDHVALGALRGISQAIENKSRFVGKTYTLAAKDTGGVLYITSGTYGGDDKHIWKETNGMKLRLYSVSDDNNIYFSIENLSSDTSKFIHLKWAALYEGSYTADTLPAYQPKGYAAELVECQRYYRRFDEVAYGFFISENGLQVEMPLNPPMRVVPTVTAITSPSAYTANGKVDVSGSYASTASKTKAGYVYYSPTAVPVGTPAVVSGMIAELSADL